MSIGTASGALVIVLLPCNMYTKLISMYVIIYEIQDSSFTTGKFLSSGHVKGPDALSVCGNLNEAMSNSEDGWHMLHCFTRLTGFILI